MVPARRAAALASLLLGVSLAAVHFSVGSHLQLAYVSPLRGAEPKAFTRFSCELNASSPLVQADLDEALQRAGCVRGRGRGEGRTKARRRRDRKGKGRQQKGGRGSGKEKKKAEHPRGVGKRAGHAWGLGPDAYRRHDSDSSDAKGTKSLVFIKTPKTGGSTVAGVVRRIGDRFNLSGTRDSAWIRSEPGVWAAHTPYAKLHGRIADLAQPPFLLTWVRHPVQRCLSSFYYRLSKDNPLGARNYSDDDILDFVRGPQCTARLKRYLGMPEDTSAEAIAKRYDFIGTTERFEESLLLLKDKLPMPVALGDILYLASKDSSRRKGLVPNKGYAEQSPRVREFFDSEQFTQSNAVDFALWRVANTLLDRQITAVGRAKLAREIAEYKRMLRVADARCYAENMQHGSVHDCYFNDNGCGIACLDRVARETRVLQNPPP